MAKIGLKHPVFAKGTYSDSAATTYAGGMALGHAISANLTINRAGATLDADDAIQESDNTVTGGSLTVELDDMTEDAQAYALGYTKEASGTGVTVIGEDAPYGGLGYVRKRVLGGVASYIAYWFYKVQLSESSDNASTKSSSGASFQPVSLDATMMRSKEGFFKRETYTTEAAAIAAVDTMAGITGK